MNLQEAVDRLEGTLLTPGCDPALECGRVFASDLMSDVLAHMESGMLLVTSLVNAHVVRTADLAEAAAVVFVLDRRPGPEVLAQARDVSVPLVSTPLPMAQACARLGLEKWR